MFRSRLEDLDPALDTLLEQLNITSLRSVALAACIVAIKCSGLVDPSIDAAIEAMSIGQLPGSELKVEVEAVLNRFDDIHFAIQDAAEGGEYDEVAYTTAFRKARAANAVLLALEDDPLMAAADAVYEAFAASDDIMSLKAIVLDAKDRQNY